MEPQAHAVTDDNDEKEERTIVIPFGGNAFLTKCSPSSPEVITDSGLGCWVDPESICSVFFKLCTVGSFEVALRLKVLPAGSSSIRVSIPHRETYIVDVTGTESYIQPIGSFSANTTGYVQLDLQGVTRSGHYFADVSELILSKVKCSVVFIADPDLFHFGRRGPSVHLCFDKPAEDCEYFYHEMKIPEEHDVVGAYFMATGFADGYFGVQVNSEVERRILFSVWSDYDTDDPDQVPEAYKIQEVKRGQDVHVNPFGEEGSGMQSFLKYPWKSETVYKFLVKGTPVNGNSTTYTAWFGPVNENWMLIASLKKPLVSRWLTGLYCFSENFAPEMGHYTREVRFQNQWVYTAGGQWIEVVRCRFTGDDTSKKGRHDFAGGISDDGNFFLRNCGFFKEMVQTDVNLCRECHNVPPEIDFDKLP